MSASAPSLDDQREGLWEAAFDTYYDALFEELIADGLSGRWGTLDDITKVIVAITASGSAISGWALWVQPGWKTVWIFCSSIAALLSVVHSSLSVPNRIRSHQDDKRRFGALRSDLETFRYRMKVEPDFDLRAFTKEFLEYRKRSTENGQLATNDSLRTAGFERNVQSQVNARLKNEIQN